MNLSGYFADQVRNRSTLFEEKDKCPSFYKKNELVPFVEIIG